jgi:hypothetical protein
MADILFTNVSISGGFSTSTTLPQTTSIDYIVVGGGGGGLTPHVSTIVMIFVTKDCMN